MYAQKRMYADDAQSTESALQQSDTYVELEIHVDAFSGLMSLYRNVSEGERWVYTTVCVYPTSVVDKLAYYMCIQS